MTNRIVTPSRSLWCVALAALIVSAALADEHSAAIEESYKKVVDATFAREYETMADYTYPGLLELMGGREQMVQLVRDTMDQLDARGIAITKRELLSVSAVVKGGDELFAVLTTTAELSTPEGMIRQKAASIAISGDDGNTWTYVDVGRLESDRLLQIVPNLPPALVIPPGVEPEFIPN